MEAKIKISDSEFEVMRVLWEAGKPLSYAEIRTELERRTDWKKSTIQTLLRRLCDKGAVVTQQNYVTLYASNVNEDEYIQSEGQNFIDKLFGGSALNLVAALCKNGQIKENDLDELKSFFDVGGDGV